jgi:hypothetical protein
MRRDCARDAGRWVTLRAKQISKRLSECTSPNAFAISMEHLIKFDATQRTAASTRKATLKEYSRREAGCS